MRRADWLVFLAVAVLAFAPWRAFSQEYGPPEVEGFAAPEWVWDYAQDEAMEVEGEAAFDAYVCGELGCVYAGGSYAAPFLWDSECSLDWCSVWTVAASPETPPDPEPQPGDLAAVEAAASAAAQAAAEAADAAAMLLQAGVAVLGVLFAGLGFLGYSQGARDG